MAPAALGQDVIRYNLGEAPDTSEVKVPKWETSLVSRFSASQSGFHNWAEGGVNSLALSTSTTGRATRLSPSWRQVYDTRLAIGAIRQSGTEPRKAEDVIQMGASVSYHGEGLFRTFNPTLAFSLRTQFAPGFNYDRNPFNDGRNPPVKVSDFFAPATLQQSIGLSYHRGKWFTQRVGVGAKETVVVLEHLRPLYNVDPWNVARYQVGVESRTEFDRDVVKNVHLKSTLGLFAAFNQPDMPDMLWENLITMRVNSWLGVNFEFAAYYDRDVSTALQLKEVLSVGVTVRIV